MQGGTKAFQKKANLALVLRTIRLHGEISRIEISRSLGLDKSTITNITSQLLDAGIIRVVSEGAAATAGGRKPVLLGLRNEFGLVLGVEIQYNQCRAALLNLSGEIIEKKTIPVPIHEPMENRCTAVLETMGRIAEKENIPIIGMGIGFPGVIDPHRGIIINSVSLQLKNYDVADQIAAKREIPILIDNDANCCAWGELVANRDTGSDNFLYILPKFNTQEQEYDITGVVGIGFGIVLDGQVYYGNNHTAGEFKSVYWKQGEIEQVAIDSEALLHIETNEEVLRNFIRELCINLSPLISVFNPGCIYIGGDLGKYYDLVMEIIGAELADTYIADSGNGCKISPTDYDIYDVAQGAAKMFLERLFDIPGLKRMPAYYNLDWAKAFLPQTGIENGT